MDFLFAQQQVNDGGSIAMFLPMVLIFAVFYFLICYHKRILGQQHVLKRVGYVSKPLFLYIMINDWLLILKFLFITFFLCLHYFNFKI